MGAIGGQLGLAGGASGSGFDAPQQANLMNGVSGDDVAGANKNTVAALQQQQDLLGALRGQNGMQNQSDVYGQFQGLAGQYQDVAQGKGPNPAQAMLAQQTGANVSNQAAMMAGQRGAGANAGLMARQAGQTGGNIQQQAVGQGATMQANQSLNALGQVGGALGNMGSIANTQVANQMAGTNALTNAQQTQQANLLNAMNARNTAQVGSQSSVNTGNASLAQTNMGAQKDATGGAMNILGGGGLKSMMPSAHGGMIPGYAGGGDLGVDTSMPEMSGPPKEANSANIGAMDTSMGSPKFGQSAPGSGGDAYSQANLGVNTQMPVMPQGPQSSFGQFASKVDGGGGAAAQASPSSGDNSPGAIYSGMTAGAGSGAPTGPKMSSMMSMAALAGGGLVDVAVSPNEKIVPPSKVEKAAGGNINVAKTVPGKAKVPGDSLKNDTVPMKLEPGSIVIPRTKATNEKDAAAFVRSVLAKRGRK